MAILNEEGKLMYEDKFNGSTQQLEFNISDWSVGNYFVKVKMRHQIFTERFVIIR